MSSYFVAFLEQDGRAVLITQTAWSRLDFFDAATGDLLTPREIDFERNINAIDYFHPGSASPLTDATL